LPTNERTIFVSRSCSTPTSRERKAKIKIQSIDCGDAVSFLFPSQAVEQKRKHRRVLGETIRHQRKRAKLSQEKLAELADLHHNYVGEIERGEKAVSIDVLVKLAQALRVRLRTLVGKL
jgi:ribosome-binding protein aMBF1 (putative translation factor)